MATLASVPRSSPYVLKRSGLRQLVCHIAPLAVATSIGLLAVQLSDRALPRVVLTQKIIPQTLHPGQFGVIHYDLQIARSCPGVVRRHMTDAHGVIFDFKDIPIVNAAGPVGSIVHVGREVPMPFGVAAGRATYHAAIIQWCNPAQQYLWPIHNELPGIEFEIVRDAKDGSVDETPNPPGYTATTTPPQK